MRLERQILERMREGNRRTAGDPAFVREGMAEEISVRHPELNQGQRKAAEQIFASREQIAGLDGMAGAGKTTTLAVIREGAVAEGYTVQGFAPTFRSLLK